MKTETVPKWTIDPASREWVRVEIVVTRDAAGRIVGERRS